jgi:hypothetical protein
MARLAAQLMPGTSGSDFTASFSGSANEQALDRATEMTVWGGTAAAAIEVLDPDGTTWRATGTTVAASGYTHFTSVPVCKGVRIAGMAAASPPPVRISVRHGM